MSCEGLDGRIKPRLATQRAWPSFLQRRGRHGPKAAPMQPIKQNLSVADESREIRLIRETRGLAKIPIRQFASPEHHVGANVRGVSIFNHCEHARDASRLFGRLARHVPKHGESAIGAHRSLNRVVKGNPCLSRIGRQFKSARHQFVACRVERERGHLE